MAVSQEAPVFDSKLSKQELVSEGVEKGFENTIDQQLPSIIEQYDPDYLLVCDDREQEKLFKRTKGISKQASKVKLGDIPVDPVDHIAMRKWLKDVYMKIPRDVHAKRFRDPVAVEVKNIPISYSPNAHFRIRIYEPSQSDESKGLLRPALLMIHGGGWIHGFPEVDEDISMYFASELRAIVIGVDYRLAPENPFPASRDDCYEALNWICDNAAEYGIDTKRIGVWGCSSGGNLAASLALKDSATHQNPRIQHVNLVAPVTCHPDLQPSTLKSKNASLQQFTHAGTVEEAADDLRRLWSIYAGDKFADPEASVLLSRIPSNHPSVHVTVAGCDGLRDEGIAYALHLRSAGTDTQLEIIPGVPHGINVSPVSLAAQQFYRNQVRVLNTALNPMF